jgi:AraC-like DNA-binding protein
MLAVRPFVSAPAGATAGSATPTAAGACVSFEDRSARVRRFNRVLQLADGARRIHWAAIAQECGYSDQAHLIRDFRAFTGSTPAQLMRRRAEGLFGD